MAEPFLGSMAGLSFAKLTQAVLRRLAPDGRDFIFNHHFDGSAIPTDGDATSNLDFLSDMYLGYDEGINFSWLAGDATGPMSDALFSAEPSCLPCLPDRNEVLRLAMFYFDHSHTLYPIVNRQEVMSDLQRIQTDQEHLLTQSPPSMFRLWMILAIGSTTHSSITLSEELTSQQYYEKAMTYFEPSMEYGDIVRIPRQTMGDHDTLTLPQDRLGSRHATSLVLILQSDGPESVRPLESSSRKR